ncbi:Uncharacterised protein [Mycobacterium tuberculosis]|nr:Uncharacterised protein [Mycobacterium tuberculosis]
MGAVKTSLASAESDTIATSPRLRMGIVMIGPYRRISRSIRRSPPAR